MSAVVKANTPMLWKYVLGAVIILIILIPLWMIFVMTVIQPDSLMTQEQTMGNRLLWWVAVPVTAVAILFGSRWFSATNAAQEKQKQAAASQQQHVAVSNQTQREYVLEIIGMGTTFDKYRQGALWDALQKGSPYVTLQEQDPKKYPWTDLDKMGLSGGRAMDALENGASHTPMYWGVPSFFASAPDINLGTQPVPINPVGGLVGGASSDGMAWHLFTVGPWKLDEHPDRLLDDVFAFFDKYPDVPYIVVSSTDDMGVRDDARPNGTPSLIKDGHYVPEMPDSTALFVLARRERVDPLRPFVWDDPDNKFLQETLRWMYYELEEAVPHPDRKEIKRTPAQVGAAMAHTETTETVQRLPTVAEWLEATAAFAKRPDIRGTGVVSTLGNLNPFKHHPPRNWKPTPWFPIPWNREQLATFDRLPTLGYLHRPTYVKFTDEHGKPLTRRDDREKALQAGWQQALQTLPEAERNKTPARVIAATGGNTDQLVMLHGLLNHQTQAGGPEIDTGKSSQFIDTDRRLGNTGAATLFMQMAIGTMGSYREGGVSAAVNLRDGNEASIVLISPPSEEKRKNQHHPKGGDVFKSKITPAIDPDNYSGPH